MSLLWQNPTNADFAGVKVMRSKTGPPTGPSDGTAVYAGPGTNAIDTGLSNNVMHYYKAYSFDTAPNYAFGVPAQVMPLNILPPPDVNNLTAVAGDQRVTLTWNNPIGGDFLGVRVQQKAGTAPSGPSDGLTIYQGAGTSVTNLNLTNGTAYYYKLFSYDEVPRITPAASQPAPRRRT